MDWLGTEPEIKEIAETVETDVVVIGAGTGGQYVAASCLEKGLKVIVLEKNTTVATLRNDWGAIGSKWQKAEGVEIDAAALIHNHAWYAANRLDMRLPKIWAEESGDAITWIGEVLESKGATFLYEGGYNANLTDPTTYPKFPTGHSAYLADGSCDGSVLMKEYIEELGGEIRFSTPSLSSSTKGKRLQLPSPKIKMASTSDLLERKVLCFPPAVTRVTPPC